MNVADALSQAAQRLAHAGVPDPAKEARSLLSFALARDLTFIIAHPEHVPTEKEADDYSAYIDRRASREPFQYITGRQEFYGMDFVVTPDVLIPRPETEILVEAAIELMSGKESPQMLEIGVGSGCISISVLKNVPAAVGAGVDIAEAALTIARQNAAMHGVTDRLTLRTGDLFHGTDGWFSLIVSNPPYIPAGDIDDLQSEVRDFEPHTALDGGPTGLAIVERIIRSAPGHLTPGGTLLLEIGFDQSPAVASLFDRAIWDRTEFLPDLQGIARITKATLR